MNANLNCLLQCRSSQSKGLNPQNSTVYTFFFSSPVLPLSQPEHPYPHLPHSSQSSLSLSWCSVMNCFSVKVLCCLRWGSRVWHLWPVRWHCGLPPSWQIPLLPRGAKEKIPSEWRDVFLFCPLPKTCQSFLSHFSIPFEGKCGCHTWRTNKGT